MAKSKRTDFKPRDMVRCYRCQRLCLRSSATRFEGVWYGPDCIGRALSTASQSTEDFIRQQLDRVQDGQ